MNPNRVPEWVRALAYEHGDNNPVFIMIKSITISDLNHQQQNRLLIPSRYAANLIAMLSEHEKDAANLLQPTARRNVPSTSRAQGRNHGGLDVCVYPQNRFISYLMLTRWDASGSIVIKGKDYSWLLSCSYLRENDEVELWGFRKGEERKLCFALVKKAH
ncbi:putative B3 domain-containing protein [Cocos nucifera]|uniref:Putative B3 domain-containing protein n=1 Tax=Cocos nucifera TaxID=13894 RepID=A0A8K0I0X0_COCNU|nr:putative B3 domain-containing protein [Cocos nucifera]